MEENRVDFNSFNLENDYTAIIMAEDKKKLGAWADQRWVGNSYGSGKAGIVFPGTTLTHSNGDKCFPIDINADFDRRKREFLVANKKRKVKSKHKR